MGLFSNVINRAANVVNTLASSLTGGRVTSLVPQSSNPTNLVPNKTLTAAANVIAAHPYATTIALGSIAKTSVQTAVKTAVKSSSLLTKAVVGVVGAVAVPAIAASPKAQVGVIKTIDAGLNLPKTGSQIGAFIENPSLSGAKQIAVSNPIATTIAGTLLAVGAIKYGGTAVNALTNIQNTRAEQANTDAMLKHSSAITGGVTALASNPTKAEIKAEAKAQEKILESQSDLLKQQTESQLKVIEAETKAQKQLMEAQTKQATELMKLQPQVSNPLSPTPVAAATPTKTTVKKKAKKKAKKKVKKKPKKKAKKKAKPKKKAKKKTKKSIKKKKK